MANKKPYKTTDELVESIQLKIAFPISQNTYTYNNIVNLMNDELQLNAVPALKELHEEYFVYKCKPTPLVNGISRYPIPNRAMAMTVRDLEWSDTSGNFFKMSRIAPEDKAFFQQNVGSNQAIGKYYCENNDVVLTPQTMTGATGNLNFFIYLRPNFLVRNDRAAFIESFQKPLVISNTSIKTGDTITITINVQTQAPDVYTFVATSGAPSNSFEFQIGADDVTTASNLTTVINNLGLTTELSASNNMSNNVTTSYSDISSTFLTNSAGISIDNKYTYVRFNGLPSTYTDIETDITTDFYTVGSKVDFLQTNPGHRMWVYDVKIRQIVNNNVGKFLTSDLMTYLNNSSGGQLQMIPMEVGDYICLANESIIPQIPPEMHAALAERTAAVILNGIGDKEGAAKMDAIVQMRDQQQATLVGQRFESNVPKVFNSMSLLRLGKRNRRRW